MANLWETAPPINQPGVPPQGTSLWQSAPIIGGGGANPQGKGDLPPVPQEGIGQSLAEAAFNTTPLGIAKTLGNVVMHPMQSLQTADDVVRRAANAATFGLADRAASTLSGVPLADETQKSDQAATRLGPVGTAASDFAGGSTTALGLLHRGVTATELPGLVGKYGGLALDSAAYGGGQAAANGEDAGKGALVGALMGAGGQGLAGALGKGAEFVAKKIQSVTATPMDLAIQKIYDAMQGIGGQEAKDKLAALGPQGMAIDVLGDKGTELGRFAANLDPEARGILENAVLGRKAGQNERLAGDLNTAAGLPANNRQDVEALKADAYAKVQPKIDAAYTAARAAGYDLPRTPFQPILDSPMGKAAYEQAANSLLNRTAVTGEDAASELARLDATKRILDSKATVAFRQGDNATGSEAAGLSKALKEQMDALVPEYGGARDLRAQAYGTDRQFDKGADLASGTVGLEEPGAAQPYGPVALNSPTSQGYAATMAERLLNRGSTDGAMGPLTTPMGKEARAAALTPSGAASVDAALSREQTFNRTAKELSGNSTTARQLIAAGLVGAGGSYLAGGDWKGDTLAGLAAAAGRKGAPAAFNFFATKNSKAMAPILAELLTRRAVPSASPLAASGLDKISPEVLQVLARAASLGGTSMALGAH